MRSRVQLRTDEPCQRRTDEASRASGQVERRKDWWSVAFLVVVSGLSRLLFLAVLPGPGGDEGAWAAYAFDIARGIGHQPIPGSEYATRLYPSLLAGVVELFGESFEAVRLLGALAGICSVVLVYRLARRALPVGPSLVAGLVMALHPIAMMWSRTASVPYSLQTLTGLVAVRLLVCSDTEDRWHHALGVLVLAGGLHFGPYQSVAAVSIGLVLLRTGEWRRLIRPQAIAAIVMGLAIVLPVAIYDLNGRGLSSGSSPALLEGLAPYLRHQLYGLGGGLTVAHFFPIQVPDWFTVGRVVGGVVLLGVVMGINRSWKAGEVLRYSATYLGAFWVMAPLLLAYRGADWTFSQIHRDRYLLAIIPYVALSIGALARTARWGRWLATAATMWFGALTLGVLLVGNLMNGGPEHVGPISVASGPRVWRVVEGDRGLNEQVASMVKGEATDGRVDQLVVSDHAFYHSQRALLGGAGVTVTQDPTLSRGGRGVCYLYYLPSIFTTESRSSSAAQASLTLAAQSDSDVPLLVIRDRAGSPIAELSCEPAGSTPNRASAGRG